MARLASLFVIALLAAPASAGPCAIPMVTAAPIVPANMLIAPGGGVLVTLTFGGYGGNGANQGLEQKGWRYKAGEQLHAPSKIDVLAPGLAVYRLPTEGDAWTLVDDKQKALVAIKRSPARVPEALAPVAKSIVYRTYESRGPHGGNQSHTTTVYLASPPPPDVVGLILFDGGTPVSWVNVTPAPKATEFVVYSSGGRCSMQIPGQREVPIGRGASVAWVDQSGRVSAKSKELVVVRGKPE